MSKSRKNPASLKLTTSKVLILLRKITDRPMILSLFLGFNETECRYSPLTNQQVTTLWLSLADNETAKPAKNPANLMAILIYIVGQNRERKGK